MILTLRRYGNRQPIEVLIDVSDYERVSQHSWYISSHGYIHARPKGVMVYLHRFISNAPAGMVVDHINRDRLDNRRANLRLCTIRQNVTNCNLSKNNKSGFRGVSFRKELNKYRAYLMFNRRQINLGLYEKLDDAIQARLEGEKKYFGEFAPK